MQHVMTTNIIQTKDTPPKNVFSVSAKGASYLILLQLFTRLLTFTFNQLLLRHTTPQIFGFATIQLDLLSSTLLFLSREGFRIALQRNHSHHDLQSTITLPTSLFLYNWLLRPLDVGRFGRTWGWRQGGWGVRVGGWDVWVWRL